MRLLEVQDLQMYYETLRGWVKAVDNVSFFMEKGEALGLAGESGCGKTSVALSILQLLPPNGRILGGKALFEGIDLTKMSEAELRDKIRWKKISIIFQGAMNALNPVQKVGDQIAEPIIVHEGVGKDEAMERACKLLELVGIDPSRASSYPHEFSGGMKQRVMIAMALVCNPELVIADEPATGLDVIVQFQVMRAIKELREKLGLSVMMITHDLSLVADICDRIAVMYAGKVVEFSEIRSLYSDPLHPYTKALLGSFPDKRMKKKLAHIEGFPPDLLNLPPGCRFRPRCPFAKPICEEEPELSEIEHERFVACHEVSS